MTKADLGEFKARGFLIGIVLCLLLAWFLYLELSSKMRPPKQDPDTSRAALLLKRTRQPEPWGSTPARRTEGLAGQVGGPEAARRQLSRPRSEEKKHPG